MLKSCGVNQILTLRGARRVRRRAEGRVVQQ